MKLVDILARELSEWPEQYVAVIQDEGGNLHGCLSQNDPTDLDQEDLPFNPVTVAWDGANTIINRAEWQAAVDALKAGEEFVPFDFSGPVLDYGSREWTGEGLPPVGTVCERSFGREIWKSTTICGHSTDGAYAAFYDGDGLMGWSDDCKFRPVRTPEQIVAIEARESAIKDLMRLDDIYHEQAAAIYDAGYRKVSP